VLILPDVFHIDEDAVNALSKPLSYVGRRDEYLPGSRSDVIQVIADWLENSTQLAFWMHGGAGLGKSTLAHKIVDSLQADGRLATFAFLLRGSSSDPATVIQTMARELCALHRLAIPEVAAAARECKASHQSLREYMECYIIKPIRSLSYTYPLVIVVDGLDEWEHHEVFLKELEYISPSSPVKILLISRPNHSIERSLSKVPVQKYQLPPVSHAITEMYFKHHFEKIDWKMRKPSPVTISDLARLADGLLIWAAMVCSFLSYEMRAGAPHELVEQILSSGKQIALEGQLSNLYYDALEQLFRHDRERGLFRRVFGAMTVLQGSLPLPDFARLLGMSDDQVIGVQSRLTALQTRGTFDEYTVTPASQRFHSSFLEFTVDRGTEASDTVIPYSINSQIAHQSVAEGCLNFLHHFLSSFRGTKCLHSDLRGLELYAVEFWPLHVANSNDRLTPLAPKLKNLLLGLAENHLRRWGSLFLAVCLAYFPHDWDQAVGCVDVDGFYCSLAEFLQKDMKMDTTLASRRTFCLEVAVRVQPNGQKAWQDLGDSYRKQFDSTNSLDSLNSAIIVYRHALELCSEDGNHLASMSELACALWLRFRRTSSMSDLEEAISMHRELLSLCPTSHPDHSVLLTNLGLGLWDRSHRTDSMTDLEEAILMHRESLSLRPAPHPDRSTSLNNLAIALRDRFGRTGSMPDLDEVISMHYESLSLCSIQAHSRYSMALNNLANALLNRFEKTGLMTDLDEAISMHRESLSLRPALHPDRSDSLYNLANALRNRCGNTGSMIDLDEAISMHRESLSLRPVPHPDRPDSLYNLANALRNRFENTGSMMDLDEAILMYRESLSTHPAHPNRSNSLNNLAIVLHNSFEKTGSIIDLDEAISIYRESLFLCPASDQGRFRVMVNLAYALETRFKEKGKQSDLDEAASLQQEVRLAVRFPESIS
jgi:tetratricopeptide (TPR) repeat protein